MTIFFSLGIEGVKDELGVLQSPGLYWICTERQQDASKLCRQVIACQTPQSRLALICAGHSPAELLTPPLISGPDAMPLFSLKEQPEALHQLTKDLMRTLRPRQRLLILTVPVSPFLGLSTAALTRWCQTMADWLKQQECSLLVLCYGTTINQLNTKLYPLNRILSGLSGLYWLQDFARYDVSWWSNQMGVSAGVTLRLQLVNDHWKWQEEESDSQQPLNDENRYLANQTVLEGLPPLSENWQLYESNREVTEQALRAHAATIILALEQTSKIDELARQLHVLRHQRGNALKIVVREMHPCLRNSDERLLMACGASLIVPHIAPLSRFLTLLETVQGTTFQRHVPNDLDALLKGMRPLSVKGYQDNAQFCRYLEELLGNTLLPADNRGVLVALKPVKGLRAEQALTLCNIRRNGDLTTLHQQHLYLFLSACRLNDLDTALKSIFRLPVEECFINRQIWYTDQQLASAIRSLRQTTFIEEEAVPLSETKTETPVVISMAQKPKRRPPEPVSLQMQQGEVG